MGESLSEMSEGYKMRTGAQKAEDRRQKARERGAKTPLLDRRGAEALRGGVVDKRNQIPSCATPSAEAAATLLSRRGAFRASVLHFQSLILFATTFKSLTNSAYCSARASAFGARRIDEGCTVAMVIFACADCSH